MTRFTSISRFAGLSALSSLALASVASADVIHWTGAAGDQLWTTAANWDLNRQPTAADTAYINTPGTSWVIVKISGTGVGTLISTHPIQFQNSANFTVFTSANFGGGIAMDPTGGGAFITNKGSITVDKFANLFAGWVMQDPGATFTMAHTCTTTVYGTTNFVKGWVLNHGPMTLQQTLNVTTFNASDTTSFVNEADGVIESQNGSGFDAYSAGGACNFINYGWLQFDAGGFIASKLYSYNLGTMNILAGTVSIPSLYDIDASGTLLEGSFYLYNGAHLAQSTNAINTIAAGAHVYLSGKDGNNVPAFMDGIYAAQYIYGSLAVDGGATLTLAPAFFGNVQNHGFLGVGPGSVITVNGGYICGADGTHEIAVADATPSGIGVFQSYNGMSLGGTLQVDFYDDQLPTVPGRTFVVANLVDPQSAFISGQFATVNVLPPNGYNTHMTYTNSLAELVVGSACVADLSGDGQVNGADLGILLANWGMPGPSDLNGSGVTDGADLGILLASWGACD